MRRQNYSCPQCNKNIGQMEAVTRHYTEKHPEHINELKELIGLNEYLTAKAKIFINAILKGEITQNENIQSFGDMINELITRKSTKKYINDFAKGKYSKENAIIFSNINKESILEYIKEMKEYLEEFEKCLKELDFKVPDEMNNKEDIKLINIENFSDLGINQSDLRKGYFFINEFKPEIKKEEKDK